MPAGRARKTQSPRAANLTAARLEVGRELASSAGGRRAAQTVPSAAGCMVPFIERIVGLVAAAAAFALAITMRVAARASSSCRSAARSISAS